MTLHLYWFEMAIYQFFFATSDKGICKNFCKKSSSSPKIRLAKIHFLLQRQPHPTGKIVNPILPEPLLLLLLPSSFWTFKSFDVISVYCAIARGSKTAFNVVKNLEKDPIFEFDLK